MKTERVQVISRDGEPEYAVLPYGDYLELLRRAEGREAPLAVEPVADRPKTTSAVRNAAQSDTKAEAKMNDQPFESAELIRLRKRAGMSQSQLAKKAQLGMMVLIQIETGQRKPSRSMRVELARALGVEQL